MRRASPVKVRIAIVGGCVGAAVITLLIVAANDRRSLAFTPDVRPEAVVALVPPGHQVCQRGIDREASFDSLAIDYGTFHRPGPRLEIDVRDSAGRRVLARGVQPAGYADNKSATTHISPALQSGAPIDVCVKNVGGTRVALYGGPGRPGDPGRAYVGDVPIEQGGPVNVSVTFLDSHPGSVLSRVPTIFRRATIFRPGWVGSWTFWLLLGAVVLAVPALLIRALGAAERESGDSG